MVCQAATRNVLFGESIAALMESRHAQRRCRSVKWSRSARKSHCHNDRCVLSGRGVKSAKVSDQALRHNPKVVKQWWRS